MPDVVITNPLGALSHPDATPTLAEGTAFAGPQYIVLAAASTAVAAGFGVVINSSGQAALAATANTAIGVALESAAAAGDLVRVAIGGVCVARAGTGGVTAGRWVANIVTAGSFADSGTALQTASPTLCASGYAVTTASSGNDFVMLVMPSALPQQT